MLARKKIRISLIVIFYWSLEGSHKRLSSLCSVGKRVMIKFKCPYSTQYIINGAGLNLLLTHSDIFLQLSCSLTCFVANGVISYHSLVRARAQGRIILVRHSLKWYSACGVYSPVLLFLHFMHSQRARERLQSRKI